MNIQERADRQFLDCNKDELKAILNELGEVIGPGNHSEETLREKACRAFGVPFAPRASSTQPLNEGVVKPQGRLGQIASRNWFRRAPRLMAQPGWEGRRRLVTLQETERLKAGTVAVLRWDGWECEIQPGYQVSISYPHYEALKNSFVTMSSKDVTRDHITGQHVSKLKMYQQPTYPFIDHGDDPATADKPTSLVHWLQIKAKETGYFERDTPRDVLVNILETLNDATMDRSKLKDISDDELRLDILTKISLYDEALEAEAA